jgi:hypothetical protein
MQAKAGEEVGGPGNQMISIGVDSEVASCSYRNQRVCRISIRMPTLGSGVNVVVLRHKFLDFIVKNIYLGCGYP